MMDVRLQHLLAVADRRGHQFDREVNGLTLYGELQHTYVPGNYVHTMAEPFRLGSPIAFIKGTARDLLIVTSASLVWRLTSCDLWAWHGDVPNEEP